MAAEDTQNAQNLAQAITEISERASLLVREEIELAKAEVTEKLMRLVKGAVVAITAGIFLVVALLFVLDGLAWLAWFELPVGPAEYFWGFFVVAGVLVILGALAGLIAARAVRYGSPPTPKMAIAEARKIRDAISASEPRS